MRRAWRVWCTPWVEDALGDSIHEEDAVQEDSGQSHKAEMMQPDDGRESWTESVDGQSQRSHTRQATPPESGSHNTESGRISSPESTQVDTAKPQNICTTEISTALLWAPDQEPRAKADSVKCWDAAKVDLKHGAAPAHNGLAGRKFLAPELGPCSDDPWPTRTTEPQFLINLAEKQILRGGEGIPISTSLHFCLLAAVADSCRRRLAEVGEPQKTVFARSRSTACAAC